MAKEDILQMIKPWKNWKCTARSFTGIVMKTGILPAAGNPNGAIHNIAGICNKERNVFGMMPHPERATSSALGNEDGKKVFRHLVSAKLMLKPGCCNISNTSPGVVFVNLPLQTNK